MEKRISPAMIVMLCLIFYINTMVAPNFAQGNKVRTEKDISYLPDGKDEPKHQLDIYYPEGLKNCPVYFFVHGGAWKKGDKSQYAALGRTYAKKGIVTVVVNYRLSPEVQHPAHIFDVAAAFAWTAANVRNYGGDPKKIFVSGHSAGAHLTSLMVLDGKYLKRYNLSSEDIKGLIAIAGVYRIAPAAGSNPGQSKNRQNVTSNMFTDAFGKDQSKWADDSPINHVRANIPPTLIMIGEKEGKYLEIQGKLFYNSLKKKGAPVWWEIIPGKGHITEIMIGGSNDTTSPLVLDFIEKNK
ncbi:MAG: alpha/beta hydrolase [Firmicutes bacterium]|nr:alpha/beta hydrolase [Bacillota bacterium]